jgi:hypothetical protein
MSRERNVPKPLAWITALVVAAVLIPRAAESVTTTLVQVGDGSNPALMAKVDPAGNVSTSLRSMGYVVFHFNSVSVSGGASKALPMKPVSGGHLTVFVTGSEPGTVSVGECVPIPVTVRCANDFTGLGFAGDGALHQAADTHVQGTQWSVSIANTGTSSGLYTLTVLDRP